MKQRMKMRFYTTALIAGCLAASPSQAGTKEKKVLVAYYSYSGNTRMLAEQIQCKTEADVFEIEPAVPYSKVYKEVTEQAKKEINEGYKPALKTKLESIAQYDTIFVGSPCWWATIAPPVSTFLSGYDWSGKTVIPFMTHEGSRMGHSEEDIRKLCTGATVPDGLPVRGSRAGEAENDVTRWLQKLKAGR